MKGSLQNPSLYQGLPSCICYVFESVITKMYAPIPETRKICFFLNIEKIFDMIVLDDVVYRGLVATYRYIKMIALGTQKKELY